MPAGVVDGFDQRHRDDPLIKCRDRQQIAGVIPQCYDVSRVAEDPAANVVLSLLNPGRVRIPVPAAESGKVRLVLLPRGERALQYRTAEDLAATGRLAGFAPPLEDLCGSVGGLT